MHVMIAGTRGIPSQHGGFETFAEDLSLFLAGRGHDVSVYCQIDYRESPREDIWNGVRRVLIPAADNAVGTISYDWATTKHASRRHGVVLTLGYNTGLFSSLYRFNRVPNVMNMDGIEWMRKKWTVSQRTWLWFNEWAGARFANHLIADHPEIARHLRRHTAARKISVIPYGADEVRTASENVLASYGLSAKNYYLLIARPEPENSILEIVRAFSSPRIHAPLVILGNYAPNSNKYHRQILEEASGQVHFLGGIYDRDVVKALRYHAKAYIHGHRVGGTNPSLVESLAAGNAIIAHDNRFTRWVAGDGAGYFTGSADIESLVDSVESSPGRLDEMARASRQRHREDFRKEAVLSAYEELLLRVSDCYR
jgi:glycosyltransferase involved in cell wall biosynthesis